MILQEKKKVEKYTTKCWGPLTPEAHGRGQTIEDTLMKTTQTAVRANSGLQLYWQHTKRLA